MCKKLKFDHTNKWYIHNTAPALENNTHKLLWDFDIHTDHLILARRLDLIIDKNCKILDFTVPADHRIKLQKYEKKDKYLDLASLRNKIQNNRTLDFKEVIYFFLIFIFINLYFLWPAVHELSPLLFSVTSVSGSQIMNNPWV